MQENSSDDLFYKKGALRNTEFECIHCRNEERVSEDKDKGQFLENRMGLAVRFAMHQVPHSESDIRQAG